MLEPQQWERWRNQSVVNAFIFVRQRTGKNMSGRVMAESRDRTPQLSAPSAPPWCKSVNLPPTGQIIFASAIRETEEFYD
jgi:hypothetical protein